MFGAQNNSASMTLSAFRNRAPRREKVLSSPLVVFSASSPPWATWLQDPPWCLACSLAHPPTTDQPGRLLAIPSVRREQIRLREAGPSLLMPGPWHCFLCQSGCVLVAFGSLHFLCGFCGRFHPPVWSLSEALACQTSLFESVPGHLLGR